jgi:hypothetical protein
MDGIADGDEEIPACRSGRIARHRYGAILVRQFRLARRLMRNRWERAFRIVAHAALDEPKSRRNAGGTVNEHAIEPLLIDIAEEVCGGDRRALRFEFEHDRAFAAA